jgi:mannosyltransferase
MAGATIDRAAAQPVAAERADWLWLAAILVVAAALRLFKLDAGLWYDEIDTLVHHTRLSAAELVTTYPSLNHHVLFTLQAKGSISLFGESAWALRLPAFVFGVLSIVAFWLVARDAVPRWEVRLATLLLAVSYHHVWFSQNARGYTGMLFWVLIATFLLVRGARSRSWLLWTAYGVAGALAIYTHLSAAFFVAAHGIVYLALAWRGARAARARAPLPADTADYAGLMPLYGFALAGILALLFHAPLLPQMVATFSAVAAPQLSTDAAAVAEWKNPLWMLLEVGRSLGPVMGIALPVIIAVVGIGMVDLARNGSILPAIVLIHIPLTIAIVVAASMRIWPRYFFIDIGFLCLFLVHGAFVIGRVVARRAGGRLPWMPEGQTVGIALATAGIAASLVLLPRNYMYPKQDLLGARDFVEAQRTAESVVVTLGLASRSYAEYYAPQWQAVSSLPELKDIVQSRSQVWLVYSFPAVTERRNPDIAAYVAAHFDRVRRFPGTLGGGDVIVFRSGRT